jgi:hypothetical protein
LSGKTINEFARSSERKALGVAGGESSFFGNGAIFRRPFGTGPVYNDDPRLESWAIFRSPSGTLPENAILTVLASGPDPNKPGGFPGCDIWRSSVVINRMVFH